MTFEQFVAARAGDLVRLGYALTHDLGLAEDLTQDVLIKAHPRWERIRGLEGADAYVRRMLLNEYLSWRRKWSRVVPTAEIIPADHLPDAAGAHADRALLRAEIARLSANQQVVLTLRYFCDLTDAEIAALTGWRPGTVRATASRALAALRVEPALRHEYLTEQEHQS